MLTNDVTMKNRKKEKIKSYLRNDPNSELVKSNVA